MRRGTGRDARGGGAAAGARHARRARRGSARAVLVADARAGERAARRSIDRATDEMAAGTVVRGRRTVAEVPSFFMPTSRAAYVLTVDRRADLAPRRGRPRTCAGAEGRCVGGVGVSGRGTCREGRGLRGRRGPTTDRSRTPSARGGRRGARTWATREAPREKAAALPAVTAVGAVREATADMLGRERGGGVRRCDTSAANAREDRAQRRNSLSRRTEPRKQSVRAITPITSAILAPRYQHPRTFHPVR